jgi:hypothetical protein
MRRSQLDKLVRQEIVGRVAAGDSNPGAWLTSQFSVTRRTASGWLSKLVSEGYLSSSGSTRKRYFLGTKVSNAFLVPLSPLDENQLWIDRIEPFVRSLPANVRNICHYGFTEMVNNAHDHSNGTNLFIQVELDENRVEISVWDNGIGIFKKIQLALKLTDLRQSLLELSKGKFTSDPANHSGEGIFFTSRIFDDFKIVANGLAFSHDSNVPVDYLFEVDGGRSGTLVIMKIARDSKREVNDVFQKFAPAEELVFDRTVIPMRMARLGTENLVSRSQAKRVLQRCERFKIVILDFSDVNEIGQGFADEIFRVYARAHPEIEIGYENASNNVESMIIRAQRSDTVK